MLSDCHVHMLLDGGYYKTAIDRHRTAPDEGFIRRTLEEYRRLGYGYLRDGGDRWGAGARARELAGEYGIEYRSPLLPIYEKGHYGAFIGRGFESLAEYRTLVQEVRRGGGDFIKIMVSGLMDFRRFGVLSEPGLPVNTIREMVHIAHEEGFAVMAHANGAETVTAAAEAGVDSVEHGAYLTEESLRAMAEAGTVWVPTLATIGCLLGDGRYPESQVREILASAQENVRWFAALGGILAPGSDAGAYRVYHGKGGLAERELLRVALGSETEQRLDRGTEEIRRRFRQI